MYNIQPIQQVLIQESIQPHPTSTWLLGTDGRGIRSEALGSFLDALGSVFACSCSQHFFTLSALITIIVPLLLSYLIFLLISLLSSLYSFLFSSFVSPSLSSSLSSSPHLALPVSRTFFVSRSSSLSLSLLSHLCPYLSPYLFT